MTESELTVTAGETTLLLNQHSQDDVIVDIENQNESQPTRQLQPFDSGSLCESVRSTCCDCALTTSPVANSSPLLDSSHSANREDRGPEVRFHVGQERQLMVGTAYQLAAVSPVFQAMLCDRWQKSGDTIQVDIRDVGTEAFAVILSCASQDTDLDITEDTVWDVLKAADKYQVLPLVGQCFYFLLHKHKLRERSRHLCMVMETAHWLSYSDHHAECIKIAKGRAGKIFRSRSGLSELCRDCMLALVTEEDLRDVPEILVNDAVLTWARSACERRGLADPGHDELRTEAGELVRQVRYLAMPRPTLEKLSAGQPRSCLLTEQEMTRLLSGDVSGFPATVKLKRKCCEDDFKNRRRLTCPCLKNTCLCLEKTAAYTCWALVMLVTLGVLLAALFFITGVWVALLPSHQEGSSRDYDRGVGPRCG